MARPTLAILVAVALGLVGARTEGADMLGVGSRVRVDAVGVGEGVMVGTVRAVRADGLRVQLEGRNWAVEVPMRSVRGLWVSQGTRGRAAIGALLGAVAGAALGYALHKEDQNLQPGEGDGKGLSAVFGAAGGAAVGGLVGSAFKSERWAPVELSSARTSALPAPPLRITVRF